MSKSNRIEKIVLTMQKFIAEEIKQDPDKIHPDAHLSTFGLDSINSIYVLDRLEDEFDVKLNPLMFYDHPTINSFATQLDSILNK